MKISLYIPVFNQRSELERTLRALIPEKDDHEVFVVDRGSSDGSPDIVARHDWATLLEADAGELGAALNQAVAARGEGEVLFFLHPGSLPARGWTAALDDFLSGTPDAGHCDLRETDAPFAWAAAVRTAAQKIGHRLLGGPAGLNGVAVKRETFNQVEGFSPVPDFEWLAFANRLHQAGAKIAPIRHQVLVAPAPGQEHADPWHDLKEDFLAAWNYRKTRKFDPVRCRRNTSAAVLIGHDVFPDGETDDYVLYAREQLLRLTLEKMQSYRGVDKIYFLGKEKSMKLIGQPSGVEVIPGPRTALQKRFKGLLDKLRKEGRHDGLLLVRGISNALSHQTLRNLAEGEGESPCMILPEVDSPEWIALWLESDALEAIDDWEFNPDYATLQAHFRPLTLRQEVEPGLRSLRTDSDARAMYYSGILDRLPA